MKSLDLSCFIKAKEVITVIMQGLHTQTTTYKLQIEQIIKKQRKTTSNANESCFNSRKKSLWSIQSRCAPRLSLLIIKLSYKRLNLQSVTFWSTSSSSFSVASWSLCSDRGFFFGRSSFKCSCTVKLVECYFKIIVFIDCFSYLFA